MLPLSNSRLESTYYLLNRAENKPSIPPIGSKRVNANKKLGQLRLNPTLCGDPNDIVKEDARRRTVDQISKFDPRLREPTFQDILQEIKKTLDRWKQEGRQNTPDFRLLDKIQQVFINLQKTKNNEETIHKQPLKSRL